MKEGEYNVPDMEVNEMRELIDREFRCQDYSTLSGIADDLVDEIERLRAEVNSIYADLTGR